MSLLGLRGFTFLNTLFVILLYFATLHAIKQSKDNFSRRQKQHEKINF